MNDKSQFDQLFMIFGVIAGVVFVLVAATLLFALIRYRASRPGAPSAKSEHKVLEAVYALCVAGVAGCLIVVSGITNVDEAAPVGKPQLVVQITAYQWCWSFRYAGTPVTVSAACQGTPPVMVVPEGEVVRFELGSSDVVHEWWLPAFDYKEEAFPGHVSSFEMRFDSPGTYDGRCDEFCGLYHDTMDFTLKVEPVAAYESWLAGMQRAS